MVNLLSWTIYVQSLMSRKDVACSQMDWSLALGCIWYLLLQVLDKLAYKHRDAQAHTYELLENALVHPPLF
jgi:hypothetical protein